MRRGGRVWGAVVVCEARWSCVGRGGRVVERRTFGQNHLLPFRNLGNFVHPTLTVSFGRDTTRRWFSSWCLRQRKENRPHRETFCGLTELVISFSFPIGVNVSIPDLFQYVHCSTR